MKELLPKRIDNSNKGTYGTVLNVSGSEKYSGAGILSSLSALKSGAGKVVLCSTDNVLNATSVYPDIVLQKRKDMTYEGISCIVMGCGLSTSAKSIFKKVVKTKLPLLIDADGLNILSESVVLLPEHTILTPHPKEMSRLMKVSVDEVLNSPREILEKCVEKYQATVVLKMHKTMILDRFGSFYENTTGNSALSKAGSGDVLAGMIGGLLAQGMSCFDASKLGVYLHGRCGELASLDMSEYSVLASDLLNYIGKAFLELLS